MKIAVLAPEAFGGRGGIALYCTDLLTALCELEHVETVVALPRVVRDAVPASLPHGLEFRTAAAAGGGAFVVQWLRLLAEARQFDLILCAHVNLLRFAEALRRRSGAPLVLMTYGIDVWQPPRRKLDAHLAGRADAMITISDFTAGKFKTWSSMPEEKIHLLPNALHVEHYAPGAKPAYLEQRYGTAGCKVILTLGRLSAAERYKGVDEVIGLMPAMLSEDPAIRYLVVGDGDDRPRLQEKARALGVQDQVRFAGWVDEAEKADHYRAADAFVMAGRGEGFGFVFLEAMACGVPVVASTLDGSREAVLDGRLGLLADPDDRDALQAAIFQALAAPRGVPEGLEYFHYPRFRERLAGIIGSVRRGAAQAA